MACEVTDGTVTLRRPVEEEEEEEDMLLLIAGRDAEFQRFMGDGPPDPDPDPDPTAIVLNTARQIVGWIDYDTDRDWLATTEANVGYNTFPEHRGRGFARRALLLMVSFLAENSEFTTATLLIDPANASSLALAQRAGFSKHGDINGQMFFKRELR